MHKLTLLVSALCFVASGFAFVAADEGFRPSDYESLAKHLAAYMDARQKNKGTAKAEETVNAELEKFEKRLKRDPLALTNDLGRALWLSRGYDKINAKKGKVLAVDMPSAADEKKDKKAKPQYAVYAPEKYNPKQAYPLILCIPDKGEKTTDHLTEKWTSQVLRESAIFAAVPMPADVAKWLEMSSEEGHGGGGNTLIVLREVSNQYAIDFDRIYLAGRGEGVAAALMLASRFPHRFAGVVGRAGDAGDVSAQNMSNLPTFFAGGGAKAAAFAESADKLGYKNSTVKADASEEDIWTWIQAHPRASNPAAIALYPSQNLPLMSYWLEVPSAEYTPGESYIKASVDRSSNTITIDADGVQRATIYFNDVLVDMSKEIKVVCNGAESVAVVPRNIASFLNSAYIAKSDPGRVFTNTKGFDIPDKPKEKKKSGESTPEKKE